jgi:hypothetical protein
MNKFLMVLSAVLTLSFPHSMPMQQNVSVAAVM